jgi:ribosomal protein S18 acetylase RimI-like enzyme
LKKQIKVKGEISVITLRRLTKEDAEAFWNVRLEGLRLHPEAFSSSYEESIDLPMENVKERISESVDNFIIGAFHDEQGLVGLAGFRREKNVKLKHKGNIWGVYVNTAFRNQGIAKQILQTIIQQAKQLGGMRLILLTTNVSNLASKKLYHSLGFTTFGIEPQAMYVNHVFLDEEFMVLKLHDEGE